MNANWSNPQVSGGSSVAWSFSTTKSRSTASEPRSGRGLRRDQPLFFQQRVDAARCHQRQQLLRDWRYRQYRGRLAVAHGPGVERDVGGLALLEGGVNAGAFERQKAEADRIAEEKAVDRIGDQRAKPEIAQRACRRPARSGAEIAAADDDVAGPHLVDPARPVG